MPYWITIVGFVAVICGFITWYWGSYPRIDQVLLLFILGNIAIELGSIRKDQDIIKKSLAYFMKKDVEASKQSSNQINDLPV